MDKRTTRSTRTTRTRQSGSIVISAAVVLAAALSLLLGVELGYLYYVKREFQTTADLSALAGAQKAATAGCTAGRLASEANAATNLASSILGVRDAAVTAVPGRWTRAGGFVAASEDCDAVQVLVSKTPGLLIPTLAGNRRSEIAASATATQAMPKAVLDVRSTMLSVDSSQSPMLDAVFGALLGGSLHLSTAGWDGLVKSNVNMLSYLDALAVELDVAAGQYDTVLDTEASAGQLLRAMAQALSRDGSAVGASLSALDGLIDATATVPAANLKLGRLLTVQSGTPAAGLDVDLQVFQLAQAIVQLANSQSAAQVQVPLSVPALGSVSLKLKVIEPPQISAVGNPELASADPNGPHRISVRTAQMRSLVSVDLATPLTGLVSGLKTAVDQLVGPLTSVLNSLLHLDLAGALSCLVTCDKQQAVTDLKILPSPFRLDVNLDIASGAAQVSGFDCDANEKALDVATRTAAAQIRIGRLGSSAADAAAKAFSSVAAPAVDPIALIDIGSQTARYQCTLLLLCTTSWKKGSGWVSDANRATADRQAFAGGGLALKTDTPLAASAKTLHFIGGPSGAGLPDLDAEAIPTPHQTVSSTNIVGSLSDTLGGVTIQTYAPNGAGGLGAVLAAADPVITGVVDLLQTAVSTVLSPLLDPILNTLLQTLGVNLSQSAVGARMTCRADTLLVH